MGTVIDLRLSGTVRLPTGRWCLSFSGEVRRSLNNGALSGNTSGSFGYTLTFRPVSGSDLSKRRVTMSHMKTSTLTIRLDDALGRELDQACARSGRTRSELARDALRRQLALLRFERLRKRTLPLAEAQGYLTDEDVFRDVS